MNSNNKNRVCPVENAGVLDFNLRKLFHNPVKILKPYIKEGMTVLDLGCGPGFFSIEIAKMVGKAGRVIAADLQDGMLERVNLKIKNTQLVDTIKLHKCQNDTIGLTEKVDFIFVFYMLHEVPDQHKFINELKTLLKPNGKLFIVEPMFHVSNDDFRKSAEIVKQAGFNIAANPKVLLSMSLLAAVE